MSPQETHNDELDRLVHQAIVKAQHDTIGELKMNIIKLIKSREDTLIREARKKAAFDMWLQGHDILRDLDTSQESINMLTIAYNRVTGEPIDDQFDQLKKETK